MIVNYSPEGTKDKNVCVGCKYAFVRPGLCLCTFMEINGRSRLVIERENGGYKTDSCICYEKG